MKNQQAYNSGGKKFRKNSRVDSTSGGGGGGGWYDHRNSGGRSGSSSGSSISGGKHAPRQQNHQQQNEQEEKQAPKQQSSVIHVQEDMIGYFCGKDQKRIKSEQDNIFALTDLDGWKLHPTETDSGMQFELIPPPGATEKQVQKAYNYLQESTSAKIESVQRRQQFAVQDRNAKVIVDYPVKVRVHDCDGDWDCMNGVSSFVGFPARTKHLVVSPLSFFFTLFPPLCCR